MSEYIRHDLMKAADLLNVLSHRIILEDGNAKFEISHSTLVGINTPDPGIVIKITPMKKIKYTNYIEREAE